jgi:hypothetical protein
MQSKKVTGSQVSGAECRRAVGTRGSRGGSVRHEEKRGGALSARRLVFCRWQAARATRRPCGATAPGAAYCASLLEEVVEALVEGAAEARLYLGAKLLGVVGFHVGVEGFLVFPDFDEGEVIRAIALLQ